MGEDPFALPSSSKWEVADRQEKMGKDDFVDRRKIINYIPELKNIQFIYYADNIFSLIPNIIMFASLSIGLYFIITYLIDKKIRNLVNAVIYEIKTRVS